MTRIKICGITNMDDALACERLGADYLGFIFAESPRQVGIDAVQRIRQALGGGVQTVGVFTEESDGVIRIMDECGLDFAQLHGSQSEDFARKIGPERIIRAARIRDEESVRSLARFTEAAFYLLDTYREGKAGGTGETFDWALAAQGQSLSRPVFLSGGLNPDNAADAVRSVRPYAVDVSSGVEQSPGIKNIDKVKEFIEHVREADNAS